MRYLILFLLGLFVIWTLRRASEGAARRREAPPRERQIEAMRECAHCGVHVPDSEAVRDGELYYCSAEHRRAGPRR